MSEIAVRALKRLTTGRAKLSQDEFEEFVHFIRQTLDAELKELAYPAPAPRRSSPTRPKPQWLKDMESAKKKIAWASPQEAIGKLYDIARTAGFPPAATKQKSFPKAVAEIAGVIGETRIRTTYVNWVSAHIAQRTPG